MNKAADQSTIQPRFCTHCGMRLARSQGRNGTSRTSCTCDADGITTKLDRFDPLYGEPTRPLPPVPRGPTCTHPLAGGGMPDVGAADGRTPTRTAR